MDWRTEPNASDRLRKTLKRPISERHFRLRVERDPGGPQEVAVRSGDFPPLIGGWTSWIVLRNNRVTRIAMATAARSTGMAEGTLKVWRNNPTARRPMLTLRRPAGWTLPAWFSVSDLAPGSYVYTISDEDEVVGGGAFETPCTGSPGTYRAEACRTGDATAETPIGVSSSLKPPGRPSPPHGDGG